MANLKKRLKAVQNIQKQLSIIWDDIDEDEINIMTIQLKHTICAWDMLYDSINDAIEMQRCSTDEANTSPPSLLPSVLKRK